MQTTAYTTNDATEAAKYVKRVKGPLFVEMLISSQLHDPELVMVVKSEMAFMIENTIWTNKEFRFNIWLPSRSASVKQNFYTFYD